MKLKKIASLMLAGIMAVSMLAGCKGEGNVNTTPDDTTDTTPATSYASTLYSALSETAQKKITFGADAELDADLTDAAGNMASGTIINVYGNMTAVQDSATITASNELDVMEADLGAQGVGVAFTAIEPTDVGDLDESVRMLFIVGSRADTLYFTEDAYRRAREPKKIHVVEGASHVDLYDKPEYVTQVVEALKEFFGKAL